MNARFDELYKLSCTHKVGVDYNNNPLYEIRQNPGLFAELILQEVLAQVDKVIADLDKDGEKQQSLGAEWAGYAIAKHFGVK
jgi:hypothetical protein